MGRGDKGGPQTGGCRSDVRRNAPPSNLRKRSGDCGVEDRLNARPWRVESNLEQPELEKLEEAKRETTRQAETRPGRKRYTYWIKGPKNTSRVWIKRYGRLTAILY